MFAALMKWLRGLFGQGSPSAPALPAPEPVAAPPVTPAPVPPPAVTPAPELPPEHEPEVEPDRPSASATGQKSLWCPFAEIIKPEMKTRGDYRKKYPEGAIVHFTAGRPGNGAVAYGREQGFCYFLIDEKGVVYQSFPLNRWGYHAGESSWPELGTGVSKYLVGIEIANAGMVTKVSEKEYKTWFGSKLAASEVRYSDKKDNIQKGYYHKYTKEQEDALVHLLLWLKNNNPDVFSFDLVLGHDEVAPKRKNDPGAALSMSMKEFRALLKKKLTGK